MHLGSFLIRFRKFYFLTKSDDFAKAIYSLCMEAIFGNNQNSLFSRILGLSTSSFFALNKYNMLVDSFLICFRQFYFLTENDDFAKAIAFGWRPFLPIFKTLLFLEY